MPVAFLYNRRLDGPEDNHRFVEALTGCNYALTTECSQLYIMENDFDPSQGLLGSNCVAIIAANVEACTGSDFSAFPMRIDDINSILTVVDEAVLPPSTDRYRNLVSIPWGNTKRKVLESLYDCADCHCRGRPTKSVNKHAGTAQQVLRREIAVLPPSTLDLQPPKLFMEPPFQPVVDFIGTLQSDEEWPDVASWLTSNSFECKHLYTVTPGWSETNAHFLPVLRCESKNMP